MRISSSSLIHFTKKKDALKGILNEDFKVKFCLEKIHTPIGEMFNAIPMVSFCDIPLSGLKEHIEKYGDYAIGLKKSWGQKNGLNPVLYVDKSSSLANNAHSSLRALLSGKAVSDFTELENNLADVVRYMKNYEAHLLTQKLDIPDYRFADEKEWRYVPSINDAKLVLNGKYYNGKKKQEVNDQISHLRLKFKPSDISYIIVKNDSEIGEFIKVLKESKGKNYSYDDVEILMTRIITKEQIINDF